MGCYGWPSVSRKKHEKKQARQQSASKERGARPDDSFATTTSSTSSTNHGSENETAGGPSPRLPIDATERLQNIKQKVSESFKRRKEQILRPMQQSKGAEGSRKGGDGDDAAPLASPTSSVPPSKLLLNGSKAPGAASGTSDYLSTLLSARQSNDDAGAVKRHADADEYGIVANGHQQEGGHARKSSMTITDTSKLHLATSELHQRRGSFGARLSERLSERLKQGVRRPSVRRPSILNGRSTSRRPSMQLNLESFTRHLQFNKGSGANFFNNRDRPRRLSTDRREYEV